MSFDGALFTSNDQDWQTPAWLFDKLNTRFRFDLDGASSRRNALCPNYLTLEDDALTMRAWPGSRVFVNPPYGRGVGKFVNKSLQQSRHGRLVAVLCFARTATSWWQDCVPHAAEVIFIRGRLRFSRGGKTPGAAPAPSAVIIFSPYIGGPPKMSFMEQPHHERKAAATR